jgi:hypothetical protein
MVAKVLKGGMIAVAALAMAVPSLAQVANPSGVQELPADRGYDKTSPHEQAINAQEAPVTQQLNNTVQNNVVQTQTANAVDQGQYDADMAAYRSRVEASHQEAMRDKRRYAHQQRAYADAMQTWREQVAACKRGHNRACELPTPNPADYY